MEFSPSDLFDKEKEIVLNALSASYNKFSRVFPGKSIHGIAADKIGMPCPLISRKLQALDGYNLHYFCKHFLLFFYPAAINKKFFQFYLV